MFLVFTVILVALIFTYTNGFHDTANAIATVVGTKVLTPRQAILLATITNLLGAMTGAAVAKTIASGLVDTKFIPPEISSQMLICALLAAIFWNLLTWYFGLPSSSSHALIGGLCGAAFAAAQGNWHAIIWSKMPEAGQHWWTGGGILFKVVIPMLISPLLGFVIAFVIMGVPAQMPTILGLAGAGLTVAMKDFIVGFFGWFVLMGRNGIRVGDWVEINGVVGEVIEIGLLRTVLLETGNWTDTGHPTGRKVAFVNSFAIEGHFFNFSTAGQWLWDELQVEVGQGANPYPLVESIQKLVEEETRGSAAQAEQEWKKSAGYRKSLTVSPAIHLRPTASGVEMQIRYITSANERYATRSRLYEKIVGLLRGGENARTVTNDASGAKP